MNDESWRRIEFGAKMENRGSLGGMVIMIYELESAEFARVCSNQASQSEWARVSSEQLESARPLELTEPTESPDSNNRAASRDSPARFI